MLAGSVVSSIVSGIKTLIYSQYDELQAVEYYHEESFCRIDKLLSVEEKHKDELHCQFTFENHSSKEMEFEVELLLSGEKKWEKKLQAHLPNEFRTPKIKVYIPPNYKTSEGVGIVLTGEEGDVSGEWRNPQIRISTQKQQVILGKK